MASVEHRVSYRNGSQIMVAGLKLALMGYRRGARVSVRDLKRTPGHQPWEFVVANDEHATLVCRDPLPPQWIQPGVMVLIEVMEAKGNTKRGAMSAESKPALSSEVTATTLAGWRRSLVQLLARLEGVGSPDSMLGVAARIARLSDSGRVPREIAALMRVISEMRNATEYQAKTLSPAEAEAAAAAWRAVSKWAETAIAIVRR